MKKVLLALSLVVFLIGAVILVPRILADEQSNCQQVIQQCSGAHPSVEECSANISSCTQSLSNALQMSQRAAAPLQSQLNSMKQQLAQIEAVVANIESSLAIKKKQISDGYKNLAEKELILDAKIRDLYIKNYFNSPLTLFLSSKTATDWTRQLAYQKAVADQDKLVITNIALSINDLQTKSQELQAEETHLTAVKATLDDQSAQLDKVLAQAQAYQNNLSSQLAELSSVQQQILAQKLGSLNISSSAYNMSGGCSSDLLPGAPDPGFSPKIGFFTYGVPNRVGMNQYGAKGRAEAGQSYSDILHAYYNADITSGYNQSIQIHVSGTNDYGESTDQTMSIEDYLQHIYEIPASWPQEALRAQAIAARSYALAYTNNGASSICTDQHCQEYKTELNSSAWIQAVKDTAGIVLTSGGQPIKAWFSSTHGGYEFTSSDIGWSSTSYTKRLVDASGSVNSFSDLQSNAYDKQSPWFYCDWGSRGGTAWLRPSEVADIVNVVMLAQADSSTKEHLYQTDKPNPSGTDTWDASRVQQELRNRGITPFTTISSMSVDVDFGSGRVTTVHANGDAPSQSFSGDFFKTYFDLRAPSNIQIVGPLFNIEFR